MTQPAAEPATRSFTVTWDYRCPFARNAHEHVLAGLADGAPWHVRFVPFSLAQVHVAESDPDVWDDPAQQPALVALQAGVAVRDRYPEQFPAVHHALFAARHDDARDLRDPDVVRDVLVAQGVDGDGVLDEIAGGSVLARVRDEHTEMAKGHHVWGVPTFVSGDGAVFVRLMDRPNGDAALARRSIERVVALLDGWPELNEFKHTSIPR